MTELAWERANRRRARLSKRLKITETVVIKTQVIPTCHYCSKRANTKDHIVPRSRLRRPFHYVPGVPNLVPACNRCNQLKGANRSTCCCYVCRSAWITYGPFATRRHAKTLPILIVDVRSIAAMQDAALERSA